MFVLNPYFFFLFLSSPVQGSWSEEVECEAEREKKKGWTGKRLHTSGEEKKNQKQKNLKKTNYTWFDIKNSTNSNEARTSSVVLSLLLFFK